MFFAGCCAPRRARVWLVFLVVSALAPGCNRPQTADQALDAQLKDTGQTRVGTLAKVGGRVTVDGQPFAARGQVLFVALIDAAHLDEAKATKLPKLYTGCKPDGTFSFHTYVQGDGVPVGKYVAVFVALHRRTAHTRGTSMLTGPDELKNLYNDPDKNAKIATFQVDAQPPGRDDYDFDLSIAGKEAVTAPGPNALTVIQRL